MRIELLDPMEALQQAGCVVPRARVLRDGAWEEIPMAPMPKGAYQGASRRRLLRMAQDAASRDVISGAALTEDDCEIVCHRHTRRLRIWAITAIATAALSAGVILTWIAAPHLRGSGRVGELQPGRGVEVIISDQEIVSWAKSTIAAEDWKIELWFTRAAQFDDATRLLTVPRAVEQGTTTPMPGVEQRSRRIEAARRVVLSFDRDTVLEFIGRCDFLTEERRAFLNSRARRLFDG